VDAVSGAEAGNGQACDPDNDGSDCASGHCAGGDDSCCSEACPGPCSGCAGGTCTMLPIGSAGGCTGAQTCAAGGTCQ
jgi:hypothetical protein